MSKKLPLKHIALTVICSAVLAACGGGGSPDAKLVDNAISARKVINMIEALDSVEKIDAGDAQSIKNAQKAYNSLNDSQKALISKQTVEKLEAALAALAGLSNDSNPADPANPQPDHTSEIKDNKSLAPLNKPAPLHTSFISSSGAQQHNPHLQLRQVDGKPAFVDNQIGLIRSLLLNKNDEVVLDGAVLTNRAENNPATQVEFLTPDSSITKYTPAGSTKENISPLFGKKEGVYSEVKTTLDERIKAEFKELKEAWETLKDPEADPKAIADAKKKIKEAQPRYADDFEYNDILEIAKNHQEAFDVTGITGILNKVADDFKNAQTSVKEIDDAWKKVNNGDESGWEALKKWEPKHTDKLLMRIVLDANSNNAIDGMKENANKTADALHGIAYVHKDKNKLDFDKPFGGVYVIKFINGVRITLHDPAAAGWTEQTFAHYVDLNNYINHGYQSLGNETPVSDVPTEGTATYRGLTTAHLTETGKPARQLTANVVAVADFAKKGLTFKTSNTHFHTLEQGARVSTPAAGYDMSGSASWAVNSNTFKGEAATAQHGFKGSLNGKFYGTKVDEIGGTYGLSNGNQQLIGGYGAKRQ
ncbi:transferrin-binding protein-like solute binding protein [Neisseria dumasiana]|uniref:Transferrin-binding protein B C-lobe/N-lobe beta-barrel domain-containing protein n=1 Tax=Neisseria dumasiana TaxID=1931275 RepID=A0ABX3WMZ9_9NEIS|nr:transferrin-binding protein-like solute binding protein [Neisseria dumasiana]OSI15263.1 hypothetical protein BV914_07715 [Neisseria dumasiana]OSI35361.1 hypothetical protein BV913_05150 [Neisseria dumasiana]UOO85039.1 transferrin-binding protein-like solute binding protein [Neisseria dumasiana]